MSKRCPNDGPVTLLYVLIAMILAATHCERSDLSDRIAALEQHHAPPDEEPAR